MAEDFKRRDGMKKQKIAILTWHYYPNFGSALQAYALQEKLKALGYSVHILDYRNAKYGKVSSAKNRIKALLAHAAPGRFSYPFLSFQEDCLDLTRTTQHATDLPAMAKHFDAVVCGSDQIWAPNVFNPVYMLNFAPDSMKKISYAASIGLNDIPEELVPSYRTLLRRFRAVSVREKAGAALLTEKCGIHAEVMPDPTLLLSADAYEKLEKKPLIKDTPYLFCYFLNADHTYRDAVLAYAKKENLSLVGHSAKAEDADWMPLLNGKIGPREFLWLIHHAKAVITDSYHGTLFSLLFHRDFITFERFRKEDSLCQNSRIDQLRETFHIDNRIVSSGPDLTLEIPPMDDAAWEASVAGQRKKATEFLTEALK